MKDIYCDLIEKFEALGTSGPAAERDILEAAEDSAYFCALSPDRSNIADCFPWTKELRVLAAGADYGSFAAISEKVQSFDIWDPAEERLGLIRKRFPEKTAAGTIRLIKQPGDAVYDVIIADLAGAGIISGMDKKSYFSALTAHLSANGRMILIADNADALKLLAGDLASDPSACMNAAETDALADAYGFVGKKVYYPLPNAAFAKNIYSDTYLPGAGSFKEISDLDFSERSAVFNEETMYAKMCEEGIFEKFAPSFMIVYFKSAPEVLPDYIRYNRGRADQYALKTEVFCGEQAFVRKTALSSAANAHIDSFAAKFELLSEGLADNVSILKARFGETQDGLHYADFDFVNGAELGSLLAEKIVDGKAPKAEIDAAINVILGDESAVCHSLDALFENVLVKEDGQYCFIDYEWVSDKPLSRAYVRYRILAYWYEAYKSLLTAYAGRKEFLENFGIDAFAAENFEKEEDGFQAEVRGGQTPNTQFCGTAISPAGLRAQSQRIAELTDWNLRLQDEIEEHKAALSKEREVERLSQNHIRNIERINAAQAAELDALRAQNAYLMGHQSLFSKIKRKLVTRLDIWAPAESGKRKLIHLVKNTIKHPIKQTKLFCTAEGRKYIAGDFKIGGEFAEGGILTLPATETPLVSIVIPAYNQVAYTYACVRSILENTGMEETPYEVILADDVSTDATQMIGEYIHNMIISRNSSNMGFLKNCNQAAAKARGQFIFFLNNDTKVHPGWLSSLVKLMDRDETIGMVGSKLVYPDGRLQEAGGIIWSDASGWNYGRLDDPEKPEYNYVKDVDYISGAAIMIRTSLWKEIGGFDEYFAPAYCEDSDLAFEVRKHGKRVVYQPQSVVTHFEGISNGTDVQGTGLKRYQLVNQEKFKEKWKEELKKQSVNTGNPDPFSARDRAQNKPCVAIIDHYVPTWDRDAGSKTTYQYIRMFLKKGFNVKFIGDNFLHEEPYTSELQQLGVEVLYGLEYRDNIYEYLKKNNSNIQFCYLNRPHIAVKYIDFLKKNTDIKCIFYGHDLHYLRILREYELTGEVRKKRESDYWRSLEFSVMEQSDMVYYPSQVEIDEIHKYHPEIPAKAITAYVWDDFKEVDNTDENYRSREGMLFVGGFKHPPNADAVKWFASNIWPQVRAAVPDAKFYVAGSGADEEILSLNDSENGIEILGFVSDERLNELYETTRMIVVPLRYGAGVKGKVVEAIYNGAAVITTSVGAEGIPDAENVMVVVDDDPDALFSNAENVEKDFAQAVIRLYQDPEACAAMSRACADYIQQNYSIDAAWSVITEDFE